MVKELSGPGLSAVHALGFHDVRFQKLDRASQARLLVKVRTVHRLVFVAEANGTLHSRVVRGWGGRQGRVHSDRTLRLEVLYIPREDTKKAGKVCERFQKHVQNQLYRMNLALHLVDRMGQLFELLLFDQHHVAVAVEWTLGGLNLHVKLAEMLKKLLWTHDADFRCRFGYRGAHNWDASVNAPSALDGPIRPCPALKTRANFSAFPLCIA